jgi:hypothetical protein
MDTISSAEFRKRYAKLTQPTNVTVLGRVIGAWIPVGNDTFVDVGVTVDHGAKFSTRPFTPVPKRTKR